MLLLVENNKNYIGTFICVHGGNSNDDLITRRSSYGRVKEVYKVDYLIMCAVILVVIAYILKDLPKK